MKRLLIKLFILLGRYLAKRTDTLLDDEFIDSAEVLLSVEPNENKVV